MNDAHCTVCGSAAGAGDWRCGRCGGPFDLPDLPAAGLGELPRETDPGAGLWRYASWIPTPRRFADSLTMGEGSTALIDAGASLRHMHVKLEFVSPTLSFKDRGAVVLVASALARGARRLVADSSGNAGSAIAAYSSRAGLPCTVFVPESTSPPKQAQIRAYGAEVEPVAGDRTAAADRAMASVAESGAMYASHVYDPFFLQGTKTFAYECWEQLGEVPDAVIVPVGNGTLLLGAARGFRELQAAGLINRVPRLIALQSERCAPLAEAWARGGAKPVAVSTRPATVAEGIAIPRPPRGEQILAAVVESGGSVLGVPEAAILPARRDLARRGLLVEPTAALVWAAALLLRRHPALEPVRVWEASEGERSSERERWSEAAELAAGTVVVPLCGSGLKSALVAGDP